MVGTPGLVQGGDRIAEDYLVTHEAHVAKQLVVVRFAVGQSL